MSLKLVCTAFVMTVAIGLVSADEFDAIIRKLEDPKKPGEGKNIRYNKITFKGDVVYMSKVQFGTPAAKDIKVVMGKYNEKEKKWEAGDPVAAGLDADFFKDPGAKTLNVRITRTDDGKAITQILMRQIGGKATK